MKRSAICSALLHSVILFLMVIGVSNPFKKPLSEQKPLIIDFVHLSEVSQAPVITQQQSQDQEIEQSLPKKTAIKEDHPLPSKEPLSQKEENPPPKSDVKDPEPTPAPKLQEKKQEKKPDPIRQKDLPKDPKQKTEKKIPIKEKVELNLDKKKQKQQDVDQKNKKKLDDLFSGILDEATKETLEKSNKGGKIKGAPADKVGDIVTGTEIDAIRRQIAKCWIVPNGARDVQDLIVDLEMKLGKDGTVLEAKVLDRTRMARDFRFRAAADSAQRAVLDPRCNPLPLNPEKYEDWKTIEMSFNPKDMY